jgi:hypothetical protein
MKVQGIWIHCLQGVESSFGQKVWATFPVAQYALRPLTKMAPLLFAYEK